MSDPIPPQLNALVEVLHQNLQSEKLPSIQILEFYKELNFWQILMA